MNHQLKLAAKDSHDIVQALTELKDFMIVDGEPDKKRQKLTRNLMVSWLWSYDANYKWKEKNVFI